MQEKKCNRSARHGSAVNFYALRYYDIVMKTLTRELTKNCDITIRKMREQMGIIKKLEIPLTIIGIE